MNRFVFVAFLLHIVLFALLLRPLPKEMPSWWNSVSLKIKKKFLYQADQKILGQKNKPLAISDAPKVSKGLKSKKSSQAQRKQRQKIKKKKTVQKKKVRKVKNHSVSQDKKSFSASKTQFISKKKQTIKKTSKLTSSDKNKPQSSLMVKGSLSNHPLQPSDSSKSSHHLATKVKKEHLDKNSFNHSETGQRSQPLVDANTLEIQSDQKTAETPRHFKKEEQKLVQQKENDIFSNHLSLEEDLNKEETNQLVQQAEDLSIQNQTDQPVFSEQRSKILPLDSSVNHEIKNQVKKDIDNQFTSKTLLTKQNRNENILSQTDTFDDEDEIVLTREEKSLYPSKRNLNSTNSKKRK